MDIGRNLNVEGLLKKAPTKFDIATTNNHSQAKVGGKTRLNIIKVQFIIEEHFNMRKQLLTWMKMQLQRAVLILNFIIYISSDD